MAAQIISIEDLQTPASFEEFEDVYIMSELVRCAARLL